MSSLSILTKQINNLKEQKATPDTAYRIGELLSRAAELAKSEREELLKATHITKPYEHYYDAFYSAYRTRYTPDYFDSLELHDGVENRMLDARDDVREAMLDNVDLVKPHRAIIVRSAIILLNKMCDDGKDIDRDAIAFAFRRAKQTHAGTRKLSKETKYELISDKVMLEDLNPEQYAEMSIDEIRMALAKALEENRRMKHAFHSLTGKHLNGEDPKMIIDIILDRAEAKYGNLLATPVEVLAKSGKLRVFDYFQGIQN